MKKVLCLFIALIMCCNVLVFADTNEFADVKGNDWYREAVMKMAEKGIIKGFNENGKVQFKPNNNMTKIEFIAIISRLLWPEEAVNSTTQGEKWWTTIYNVAKSHSLFTSTAFSIENMEKQITREEMSEIIVNSAIALDEDVPSDVDNIVVSDIQNVSDAFKTQVKQAYALGFLSGVDKEGNFKPNNNVKRCEAATVIYRLIDTSKRVVYTKPAEKPQQITVTTGVNGLSCISLGKMYDEVIPAGENLLAVYKNEYYGLINLKGELVLPIEYDEIYYFEEGLSFIQKDGKYGVIDNKGKIIAPLQYYDVDDFSEGLAPVMNEDGMWGFIDKTGKTVIDFKYNNAKVFSNGLAAVSNGENWGYIDKAGKTVLDFKYETAENFNDGFAHVHYFTEDYLEKAKTYEEADLIEVPQDFMIDKKGNIVYTFDYTSNMGEFSEGLLAMSIRGELMFINTKFETTVPSLQYEEVGNFCNGLAYALNYDGECGFIDKSGKEVIKCVYTGTDKFKYDFVRVFIDGKAGAIDKTGKVILPLEFDAAYEIVNNLMAVQKDGNWFVYILK